MNSDKSFSSHAKSYLCALNNSFTAENIDYISRLSLALLSCWRSGRKVFLCGNGGSAANAIHISNDLHYGVAACGNVNKTRGIRTEALTANEAIITCLGNDIGYENIFSHQLEVKGEKGDLLIVLSGSGNSKNIINVLQAAKQLDIVSFAILGYDGGKCIDLADFAIHFAVNDMQIAEDTQLLVGHICMQWLSKQNF